jgi:superfamily II DNA or RNA helicase
VAGFAATLGAGIDVLEADLERVLGEKKLRVLLQEFEHTNPDHGKRRSMGYSTYGVSKRVQTWERITFGRPNAARDLIRFPRGGTERIREAARLSRARVLFRDRRLRFPEVDFPEHRLELRWYQRDALAACIAREQGIIRAPTGSGKTTIAIAFAAAVRQPTLVVVRKRGLLVQWLRRLERELGIDPREVGQIGGGKRRIGPRFTLALQQSLSSAKFPLADFAQRFGTILIDECHEVAASLFQRAVCAFPARYRIGFSADETRKDRKEFLVYDQLDEVLLEVSREDLEKDGSIVPVVIRIVETDFEADGYADAPKEDRNFGALMDEMEGDQARNDRIVDAVRSALEIGQRPVLVFSRRREHARHLADERLFACGIRSGLLLGGPEMRVRFDEDLARLDAGGLDASVGTIEAVGTGTDVPSLRAGVMGLPLGDNRQLLNQVRGRICRPDEGKRVGYLYYLLDRAVFPGMASRLHAWTQGRVEAWAGTAWVPANRQGFPKVG